MTKTKNEFTARRATAKRDQITTVRFTEAELKRLHRERSRLKLASVADVIRQCIAEHFAAVVLVAVMAAGTVGCETTGDGPYMADYEGNRYLDTYRNVPDRVRVESVSQGARDGR